MAAQTGYTRIQIALHWVIALLIAYNYLFSEGLGKLLDQHLEGTDVGTPAHVWIGVAVFVLVLVRLVVRLVAGVPEAPGVAGSAQVKAADWGHRLLYLLMIAAPLAGALAWYKGIEALGEPHALLANLLVILAGLHALMALYHQYVLKDRLLLRMMKAR